MRNVTLPAIVMAAGEKGAYRFLEFFAAQIRNPNTRAAYIWNVCNFFAWCEKWHVRELSEIRSAHVASYIERPTKMHAALSVKHHLAAIRMLFNWLVVGQIVEHNSAAAVRGPKHVVRKGKTPVLLGEEARKLLDSIKTETVIGLWDRTFIGLLIYTFARVSAAMHIQVDDVYIQRRRLWVRLHEKGGKEHALPCHHELEEYVEVYMETAGIKGRKRRVPLPRCVQEDEAIDGTRDNTN